MEIPTIVIMYRCARDGLHLQKSYPEIADDYRAGLTQRQISDKYGVKETYKIKKDATADTIVHYALAGSRNSFHGKAGRTLNPYKGLLTESEMAEITRSQRVTRGHKIKEMREGIFGLDNEALRKNASAAGKIGGAIGARTAHLNQGRVLWTDVEVYTALLLTYDPEYHARKDIHARKNATKIASKLNELFHKGKPVRTAETVRVALYRKRAVASSLRDTLEDRCF